VTAWTSFHLRVLTPLFSGDDPNSTDSPIRVPSVRGALRYWFRAVAAGHGITDLDTLSAQESAIFGSTQRPSAIGMRISGQPRSHLVREPDWVLGHDRRPLPGVTYLLGLGLWKPGNDAAAGMQRPFVKRGTKVTLEVRFGKSDTANYRFMHAFRAWLLLGGLGSRVRRGFGQLELMDISGRELPGLWEKSYLMRPESREKWQEMLNAEARVSDLEELDDHEWGDARPAAGTLPRLPVLARPWWGAAVRPGAHDGLGPALHSAGQEWRSFMLTQKVELGLSTPEWQGAILGNDSRFPRGALGLPVTYYRRADHRTNQAEFSSVVQPDGGSLRRASPVWIRPVRVGSGTWATMTQIFRCELLPGDAVVTADGAAGDKDLTIPPEQAEQAWDAWLPPTGRPQRRLPRGYYHTNGS
jgi:CRISPR-associated protein Cmr1